MGTENGGGEKVRRGVTRKGKGRIEEGWRKIVKEGEGGGKDEEENEGVRGIREKEEERRRT